MMWLVLRMCMNKVLLRLSTTRYLIVMSFLFSSLCIFSSQVIAQANTTTTSTQAVTSTNKEIQFLISPTELVAAGFSDVETLASSTERFQPPVQYFRVGQKIAPEDARLDCGDCANLVAIYITPLIPTSTPLAYVKNNQIIKKIAGRTQISFSVAARIVFITSPEERAAQTLATRIRERIILNQTLVNK